MTPEPQSTPAPSEAITEKPGGAAPSQPGAEAPAAPAAAPISLAPPTWPIKVDYANLAMVFVLAFFLGSFVAANSDIWIHLATGKRMAEGKFEFGVDPHSWATEASGDQPAVPWVHHSWLYSWLLYQLYLTLGGPGLVLVKALIFTIGIVLLSRIGWQESNRWFIVVCLMMAALSVSVRLFLQPVVVSFLFLSITLYVLDRAGAFALVRKPDQPEDSRWLWGLPPLFALWANLDNWFILGPMLLALCWLATGLGHWFKGAGLVPGRTLGMVLGVGLIACLLNPFHVRVFQLPPELAYLVLSLHIPLPDEVGAGGLALMEMRSFDKDFPWMMSTLKTEYLTDRRFGWNISAVALYPLLMLGLVGFTLTALIKQREGAPTLQLCRFLSWLIFGVMALALYRLIPFFALVAAPLTAMTLGEFVRWQQSNSVAGPAERARGLNTARLVTVPFLVLLLTLAWLGWLHAPTEGFSPRHVGWDLRTDPSLERAAKTLQALKEKGEGQNVFNVGFDFGNYLPWFAPDVKFGIDTRFALYARHMAVYGKTRDALMGSTRKEGTWQDVFLAHKVDLVMFSEFARRGEIARSWWDDDQRWRQRYGDVKTMIFSWSGPARNWAKNTAQDDWNRQAFGPVDEARRPPARGAPTPPAVTFWTQFTDPGKPPPIENGEYSLLKTRYMYERQKAIPMMLVYIPEKESIFLLPIFRLEDLVDIFQRVREKRIVPHRHLMMLAQAMPAGGTTIPHTIALQADSINPTELGPPALLILALRATRQAVAENPSDGTARALLVDANESVRRLQEADWTRPLGPGAWRQRLRQVQLVTGVYHAAQLRPEDFDLQNRLAQLYLEEKLLDVALDQMRVAEKTLEALKGSGKVLDPRGLEERTKQYKDEIKAYETAVTQRVARWKDMDARTTLHKALLAFKGEYQELVGDRERVSQMSLARKALETLDTIKEGDLKKEEELVRMQLRLDLLLRMGHADVIAKAMEREDLRRTFPEFHFLAGAALGDYLAMEEAGKALEETERVLARAVVQQRQRLAAPSSIVAPGMLGPVPYCNMVVPLTMTWLNQADQHNSLFNFITLRGILALEAGDTKKARAHFQRAIDEAGTQFFFSERPIARRYLDLLNEQWQR